MVPIQIRTQDGICRSFIATPGGSGPWPAVLVFMDGIGIRPAVLDLGDRLASHGYFVLLPDLFYRAGPYEPMDARTVFSNPEKRKVLMEKYFAVATSENILSDTRTFLDFLAEQPEVEGRKYGITGYCMGGRLALIAAGTYPDRFAAAASFHGGRLANEAPDSPHLLAPKMKDTRVLVAGAIEDASFPDDMKARLEESLTKAGVDHRVETYQAKHGWVFRDHTAYDEAASERHYRELVAFFDATLKK